MPKSPEERYTDWLNRMEIPLEAQSDIEAFKDYLKDEFKMTNPAQIEALWSAIGISDTLADHDIYIVGVREVWGRNPRYAIQGLAGLWGWERVQEVMREEE